VRDGGRVPHGIDRVLAKKMVRASFAVTHDLILTGSPSKLSPNYVWLHMYP
jgi:hypothetical protein